MDKMQKYIDQQRRQILKESIWLCVGLLGAAALLLGFLQYGLP